MEDILSLSITNKNLSNATSEIIKIEEDLVGNSVDLISSVIFQIPIYSLILKPIKHSFLSFKEYRELKMLARFFNKFENLKEHERVEFSYMLSSENGPNLSEKLIYLISQMNDEYKCNILSNLSIAFARKKIDKKTYLLLIDISNSLFSSDLKIFNEEITKIFKKGDLKLDDSEKIEERFTEFVLYDYFKEQVEFRLIYSFKNYGLIVENFRKNKIPAPIGNYKENKEVSNLRERLGDVYIEEYFSHYAFLLFYYGFHYK
ncbi:hypothetical protein [Algoriphagus sp.]|uniref:hypothetical protein n=1 Tax=Algoriphagus sp. TaxID=1872435 RepID=UPI00262BC0EF|nr:hypothetical protein [Algoriphagus sp.]